MATWVNEQQSRGQYAFTRAEAQAALSKQAPTLTKAIQRLCASGRIERVCRGFYAIVPLEYKGAGGVPAEWYLSKLMKVRRLPFYVGLLTAAAWHGAGHQQPQELHVVTVKQTRKVKTKRTRISFFVSRQLPHGLTEDRRTQTGDVPVSTPAWTALDLLRFQSRLGGFDSITPVLAELAENIRIKDLLDASVREQDRSLVRRLGWLLSALGFDEKVKPLLRALQKERPIKVLLDPAKPPRGRYDSLWCVVKNAELILEP
ncbi:MAG: hypothetical protein GX589_02510 [Deltaproteobacteria bacterium]|nr:hypothetical protein [Deltaproteobacteria bacterium]